MFISRSKNRGDKTKENHPASFRFGEETKRRLDVVCAYANKKKTVVLEELIDKAYETLQKSEPLEIQKVERKKDFSKKKANGA